MSSSVMLSTFAQGTSNIAKKQQPDNYLNIVMLVSNGELLPSALKYVPKCRGSSFLNIFQMILFCPNKPPPAKGIRFYLLYRYGCHIIGHSYQPPFNPSGTAQIRLYAIRPLDELCEKVASVLRYLGSFLGYSDFLNH